MKKSLVLAAAMALGVTASAYAANPFSDVPAGHWAYDSIDKLAAAGVIEGMGDGTYQGDRNMTRYEMAQIVAKAMAKGANVDKLAAEFADELDALGVRVAALEKKADNVTITGQIRYEYKDGNGDAVGHHGKVQNRIRSRIFLNGQINEDWAYHARFENNSNFNSKLSNDVAWNNAYVTGKIGGLKVNAGKNLITKGGDDILSGAVINSIQLEYGKKVKLTGYVGDNQNLVTEHDGNKNYGKVWGVGLATQAGATKLGVELNAANWATGNVEDEDGNKFESDNKVVSFLLDAPLSKKVSLAARYHINNANKYGDQNVDHNGYTVALNAKASKVTSLWAKYYNLGAGIDMGGNEMNSVNHFETTGYRGYKVGASVALAKNIVYMVEYYNLDAKSGSSDKERTIYNRLQFSF